MNRGPLILSVESRIPVRNRVLSHSRTVPVQYDKKSRPIAARRMAHPDAPVHGKIIGKPGKDGTFRDYPVVPPNSLAENGGQEKRPSGESRLVVLSQRLRLCGGSCAARNRRIRAGRCRAASGWGAQALWREAAVAVWCP